MPVYKYCIKGQGGRDFTCFQRWHKHTQPHLFPCYLPAPAWLVEQPPMTSPVNGIKSTKGSWRRIKEQNVTKCSPVRIYLNASALPSALVRRWRCSPVRRNLNPSALPSTLGRRWTLEYLQHLSILRVTFIVFILSKSWNLIMESYIQWVADDSHDMPW